MKKKICLVSTTNYGRNFFNILRDSGFNVFLMNESLGKIQNLPPKAKELQSSLIIIDLGYPREGAYLFLEKIREDSFFSDVKIMVIVNHKTQIKRMKSFAFGVDSYLSSAINKESLLKRIEVLFEPAKKYKYEVNIEGDIEFEALITHINETGALINSKAFFPHNQLIELDTLLFKEFNMKKNPTCHVKQSRSNFKKTFINELAFAGLDENDLDLLRKGILKWRNF